MPYGAPSGGGGEGGYAGVINEFGQLLPLTIREQTPHGAFGVLVLLN